MARGGNLSCKRNFRRTVQSKERGSDDSDADYVISDDCIEVSDGSGEFCSSLDGCESEEHCDSFVEEEEEEDGKLRKVNRSKVKTSILGRQENGGEPSRKRGKAGYVEKLEEEEEGEGEEEGEEYVIDEDEDDEDFTLDGNDFSDEEELKGRKGKKRMRTGKRKNPFKSCKRRSVSRVSKKPMRTKRRKTYGSQRKVMCDNAGNSIDSSSIVRGKSNCKKKPSRRKKTPFVSSDSDSLSSGSTDYEYTISEEEREQVREANEFFLRTNLRSSAYPKVHEDPNLQQQRKTLARKGKEKIEEPSGRKGKEKLEDVQKEKEKQVCGICFSEEDKRRVQGLLNSCVHYFCFACIMEWAKVESRCPLCKQRFTTISKPARSMAGIDLREVMIQIPERDQVYQPSEEELRSYNDPYEYVICSECNEGGDDNLMLLCDLCDSPAHTYCVGLGREVPEGNWYCEDCRPVALGTSSSQVQDHVPDLRTTNHTLSGRPSPLGHIRETIDLNMISSPRISFPQGIGYASSPRFSVRGAQGVSPVSGGAPTLSERRWIQRQIQQLLSIDRMNSVSTRTDGISTAASPGSNLYNTQINQSRETASQCTGSQDTRPSYYNFFGETLCNNSPHLEQNRDFFSTRINNPQRQVVQDSSGASTNRPANRTFWPGILGINVVSDHEQLYHCNSRLNVGIDGGVNPCSAKED